MVGTGGLHASLVSTCVLALTTLSLSGFKRSENGELFERAKSPLLGSLRTPDTGRRRNAVRSTTERADHSVVRRRIGQTSKHCPLRHLLNKRSDPMASTWPPDFTTCPFHSCLTLPDEGTTQST
jgi:hypothetical protein